MIGQQRNRARQARDPWTCTAIATHLRALRRQRATIGQRIAQHSRPNRNWRGRRSACGPHPVLARILRASCSRICPNRVDWTGAALAGRAPKASESGRRTGQRRVWGGCPQLRRALFIAALAVSPPRSRPGRLPRPAGNRRKIQENPIIAVACKPVTILHAMTRNRGPGTMCHSEPPPEIDTVVPW